MQPSFNVLLFAASLRKESLNHRLIELVAQIVRTKGATADVAKISDFDCPSYDGDVEGESGIAAGALRLRDLLPQRCGVNSTRQNPEKAIRAKPTKSPSRCGSRMSRRMLTCRTALTSLLA